MQPHFLSAGIPKRASQRSFLCAASNRQPSPQANIVRDLRDLAKAPQFGRADEDARAEVDRRIDDLATQFRSATADGARASSRDLGTLVWSLAKLSTRCCCGHAAPLLRALTASPAALTAASNQTLCNALYGAALLARNASGAAEVDKSNRTSGGAVDGGGSASSSWPELLPPARVLAAACVPRLASFNFQDITNTWWAVATLSSLPPPPSPPPISPLASPSSCPHSTGGEAETKGRFAPPEGLLEALSSAAARQLRAQQQQGASGAASGGSSGAGGGCSARGVANMLWGAARMGHADGRMLGAAVELLHLQVRTLPSSDPRALATCLWALASLRGAPAEALLSAASRPAATAVRQFDDQSLSNLLWAYGTLGVAAPRLFAAAAEVIAHRAPWMGLQFLAICSWAFATNNHREPGLLAAVAEALTTDRSTMAKSTTAREAATGARRRGGAARQRGGRRVAEGSGCDGGGDEDGAEAAAEAALVERLEACDGRRTQALANLAWSYASLGARHDPLMAALTGRAAAAAPALNAQELSNVLYGAARLMPYMASTRPGVLQALLHEVDRRLAGRNSGGVGTSATPTTPMSSGSPDPHPHHRHLTPRDLAMLSWSVAILSPHSPTLHRLLQAAVAVAVDATDGDEDDGCEFQAQPYNLFGLSQLYGANYAACLAAAVAASADDGGGGGDGDVVEFAGEVKPAPADLVVVTTGGSGGAAVREVVRAAAAAMRQAQSAAETIGAHAAAEDGGRANGGGGCDEEMVRFGPLGRCPALFRACRDAWLLNTASTKPSDLQTAVAAALREGGGAAGGKVVAVAEEALSPDRMLRVDLLVQYDGWLVLLEVDGPSHFAVELAAAPSPPYGTDEYERMEGRGLRPLGDTVLRNRFLAASLSLMAGAASDPRVGGSRDCDPRVNDLQEGGGGGGDAASAPLTFTTRCRATDSADAWVTGRLLEQLSPPVDQGRPGASGSGGEGRFGPEGADGASGGAGVVGAGLRCEDAGASGGAGGGASGGMRGQEGVRGVAWASLSYAEWNAAGPRDKWAGCLAPLLQRATAGRSVLTRADV